MHTQTFPRTAGLFSRTTQQQVWSVWEVNTHTHTKCVSHDLISFVLDVSVISVSWVERLFTFNPDLCVCESENVCVRSQPLCISVPLRASMSCTQCTQKAFTPSASSHCCVCLFVRVCVSQFPKLQRHLHVSHVPLSSARKPCGKLIAYKMLMMPLLSSAC